MGERFVGTLGYWFETGTEGVCWVLQTDVPFDQEAPEPYCRMLDIEHGDKLKVTAPDGSVVFDDIIRADFAEGWRAYPQNPKYGQPVAFGYWIHWTQYGWKAEDWARLFFEEKCRGELTLSSQEERRSAPRPIPPPGVDVADQE